MNNYISLIKKSSLLKFLSIEKISSYLNDRSFKVNSYNKNNIIHFSGDVCLKLEIILSGNVVVERIDESGNLMTIAEFFSNEILGGNILFSKNPHYPMTITTRQPTVIIEISKNRLFKLLQ
jgi:CRP/FNR family transcriptional regulator, dissimilatory nitrate respiration regulator